MSGKINNITQWQSTVVGVLLFALAYYRWSVTPGIQLGDFDSVAIPVLAFLGLISVFSRDDTMPELIKAVVDWFKQWLKKR